ncbi:MarR family transcriptional regulator [Shewanella sedimentimangrovi]|uniref:MarR family transcriptional regulator n=1 Tax=Shewanella sedimentimangrovi TaxID=2814293 RepID=A0ABX7QYG1_9GAMM|nr:MarR family transcriptional regulator [Shewanella sedimentimangrovi]QSX35895.1 MarR family transcriptional regulator [Shewanella sedimentimangrovi]
MELTQALIQFQRCLAGAWHMATEQQATPLTVNEFEYLWCVHQAGLAEMNSNSHAQPHGQDHDDSSHLSALAAEMQVQKSSASAMVNRLEKKGLIRRVTCQFDARAQHILLTEQGLEQFLTAKEVVYAELNAKIGRCLSPAELSLFVELLMRINAVGDDGSGKS